MSEPSERPEPIPEALTVDRIQAARETLTAAAFLRGFPGAIEAREEPLDLFIEAKRNLTALVQYLYGDEAWERVLDEH